MRTHGLILVALGLVGTAAGADDGAARAVVDKAIAAHGGEAALSKWPTVTAKTEGIFHGHKTTPVFFFTSEVTTHGADRWRCVLNGKLNGQAFLVANGLDGNRGWVKLAGNGKEDNREFTADELRDHREDVYLSWVGTLAPLKSRDFTLALAGEATVANKPAVGVRVSSKGHRDATLFFDKGTGLLVKTETRSMAGTGVEGKVETFLGRHKEFGGTQRPMTMMVQYDGVPLVSHWVLDYQLAEAPARDAFIKP